jgi:hypothetical protein
MQSNQRKCSKAAIVFMIGLFASVSASAGGLLYQPQFPDQPAAYVPPAVLVGFNPQPEPPARLVIAGDLSARDPGVLITGIEGENIDLLLGIGGGHQRLAGMFLVGDSCGIEANIRLYPLFRQVQIPAECRGAFRIGARFTDGSRLNLDVTLRALRGDTFVPPATLVGFNPQPEPPAIPSFGLRVDLRGTAADGVSVDVALSDRRGNVIPLR